MMPLPRKVVFLSLIPILIAARTPDLVGRFALNVGMLQVAGCLEGSAGSEACAPSRWLAIGSRLGQPRATEWEARLPIWAGEPHTAVTRFRNAIALNPRDPFLPIGLLYALDAAGDSEAFLATFAQHTHPRMRSRSDELYDTRTGQDSRGEAGFDPNEEAKSGDITMVNLLRSSRHALERGDWTQARQRLAAALSLRPEQPVALDYLLKIPTAARTNLPTQPDLARLAGADFDDAVAGADPRLAAAAVEVASRLVVDGKWSDSRALNWARALVWCCSEVSEVLDFVAAIDRRDASSHSLSLRGGVLVRQARYEEAMAALEPATRSEHSQSEAWTWIGRIANAVTGLPVLDDKLAAQVERVLERGLADRPDDVFLLHSLQSLYGRRGDGRAVALRTRILGQFAGRPPADAVGTRLADGRVLQGYTYLDEARAMRDGIGEVLLFLGPRVPSGCARGYAHGATCIEIATVRNLVPNGGFEWTTAEALPPLGFPRLLSPRQTRPEAAILSPTDERAPGGHSLIIHTTMALTRNGVVSRDIAVEPGASYLLAATVRSHGGAAVSLGCELGREGAPGKFMWAIEGASPANWTRVNRAFTVPPAVRHARIWVTGFNRTGRDMAALADNISLIRLSAPRHP